MSRCRALEFQTGLAEAAELGEEIAANARQEVVVLERGLKGQHIDKLKAHCWPDRHRERDRRFSSTTGDGASASQLLGRLERGETYLHVETRGSEIDEFSMAFLEVFFECWQCLEFIRLMVSRVTGRVQISNEAVGIALRQIRGHQARVAHSIRTYV